MINFLLGFGTAILSGVFIVIISMIVSKVKYDRYLKSPEYNKFWMLELFKRNK